MKRSMIWPPVILRGRALMTQDPGTPGGDRGAALRQMIALQCQDAASTNPWLQDLGTALGVFKPSREASFVRARASIQDRFRDLEIQRRARLVSLDVAPRAGGAQVVIALVYDDLEVGSREALEVPLGG